jgi:hypothetical protein
LWIYGRLHILVVGVRAANLPKMGGLKSLLPRRKRLISFGGLVDFEHGLAGKKRFGMP